VLSIVGKIDLRLPQVEILLLLIFLPDSVVTFWRAEAKSLRRHAPGQERHKVTLVSSQQCSSRLWNEMLFRHCAWGWALYDSFSFKWESNVTSSLSHMSMRKCAPSKSPVLCDHCLSFFLSWVSKTQPNHWTKRMAIVAPVFPPRETGLFEWHVPMSVTNTIHEGSQSTTDLVDNSRRQCTVIGDSAFVS